MRISGRKEAVIARGDFIYERYYLHVNSLKREKEGSPWAKKNSLDMGKILV